MTVAFFILAPHAAATEVSYTRIPWEDLHVISTHPSRNIYPTKVSGSSVDLTAAQETWINKLAWCESRDNPNAINPMDLDHTPSFGKFQFKPSTFAMFARAYGMASTTDFMNPVAQRAIVERMMSDPSVHWGTQFPYCVKKYIGMPPDVAGTL